MPLQLKNLGTNLTRKGKYSSTLTEPLQIRARASSYQFSLGRPQRGLTVLFIKIVLGWTIVNLKIK